MGKLATVVVAALLMQAPALKAQSGGQASAPTGKSAAAQAGQQVSPSAAPAPSPATAPESTSEAGETSRPMSSEEADAAIDKLREAVHDSMQTRTGSVRQMDPEAQKQLAETADKLLSDPIIRGALARQIRDFRPPWQQGTTFWLSGVLVPIAFFAFCGLYFWLRYRQKQNGLQAQMAAQTQLIAKFSSGAELAAFLSSPAGQQLTANLSSGLIDPKRRIMRHTNTGVILSVLGLGIMIFHLDADRVWSPMGGIVLFLGLGFLISAWLTSRLAEKMGQNLPTSNTLPPTLPPQQ